VRDRCLERPLIGVSASAHDFGDYGPVGVHRPLLDAGALPMALAQLVDGVDAVVEAVDAIVLAPGRDIEPVRYGQEPHHHQAIDRVGAGLSVVAWSADDGLPEAVEMPGRPVLAVQWELQEEWRVDRRFARVFEWFVGAARAGRVRSP
jgi:gamma-glutamyl-gamma-aminobutyrate hydrolase PuuD